MPSPGKICYRNRFLFKKKDTVVRQPCKNKGMTVRGGRWFQKECLRSIDLRFVTSDADLESEVRHLCEFQSATATGTGSSVASESILSRGFWRLSHKLFRSSVRLSVACRVRVLGLGTAHVVVAHAERILRHRTHRASASPLPDYVARSRALDGVACGPAASRSRACRDAVTCLCATFPHPCCEAFVVNIKCPCFTCGALPARARAESSTASARGTSSAHG